jgi:hypothetical protein
MSESEKPRQYSAGSELAAWRTYFLAALTGLLAGATLSEETGIVQRTVSLAGQVADAAVEEEQRRVGEAGTADELVGV